MLIISFVLLYVQQFIIITWINNFIFKNRSRFILEYFSIQYKNIRISKQTFRFLFDIPSLIFNDLKNKIW